MTAFDTWESYLYPPPHEQTLRNLLDERDPGVLAHQEYGRTELRQREILTGKVDIPRTYDAEHVRAIHRHLFQDVYAWAGELRTVGIQKGPRAFAEVHDGEIGRYLDDVHRLTTGTRWADLGRDEFAERAATVFAHLNQAHPFREGNGRTSKVFMEHVAEQSRFTLDYGRVTPELWNQRSMLSAPDLGSYAPVPDELVPVFRSIAVERAQPPAPTAQGGERARSPRAASFPTSAQDATRAPRTSAQDPATRPGRGGTARGPGAGRGEGR